MKRLKTILIWVLGISFIILGFIKYIDLDAMTKPIFDRANYPKWFFYAIATTEFVGGVLLLMTTTTSKRLGSLMIAGVMLGALGTRFILKEPYSHFILPGIIFLIAILMSFNFGRKEK